MVATVSQLVNFDNDAERVLELLNKKAPRPDIDREVSGILQNNTGTFLRPTWAEVWQEFNLVHWVWMAMLPKDADGNPIYDRSARQRTDLFTAFIRLVKRPPNMEDDEVETLVKALRQPLRAYLESQGKVIPPPTAPVASVPAGARQEGPGAVLPSIVFLAEKKYHMPGTPPVVVSTEEDTILQAFLDGLPMETSELTDRSGVTNPSRAIKDLATKYNGVFAPAIKLAGAKGQGGYFIRVCKAARPV